jgi:hypothetical protein
LSAEAPILSVVMPTRNQAAFIASSIHSVLSQDIEGLELVVADGASTDDTPAILQALAAQHPGRISWCSEPDSGPADAVNRAVARARGPVIGWLNSDDLYTPGAAAAALAFLRRNDGIALVYGEGEHIDETGSVLGRYPTRPPDVAPATVAEGCPVCQPTVFMRRDAFLSLGGLDTSLSTAFDFDLWLRWWKTAPASIGYIPRVQAQTRLHAGAITLRMREQVALEGLRVLHRHTGHAPSHWLLTHLQERKALHPFGTAQPVDLRQELHAIVQRGARWLSAADVAALDATIDADRAIGFSSPHWYVDVDPDGNAGPDLEIRIRQATAPLRALRIHGRSFAPRWGRLRLSVEDSDGRVVSRQTCWRRSFVLEVPTPSRAPGATATLRVRSVDAWAPADFLAGSTDRRLLSFVIKGIKAVPAA